MRHLRQPLAGAQRLVQRHRRREAPQHGGDRPLHHALEAEGLLRLLKNEGVFELGDGFALGLHGDARPVRRNERDVERNRQRLLLSLGRGWALYAAQW
jgi:hypothetical protein